MWCQWGQKKAQGWDRFQEKECLHLGNSREAEGGKGEESCWPTSGWTGLSSLETEEPGGDSEGHRALFSGNSESMMSKVQARQETA